MKIRGRMQNPGAASRAFRDGRAPTTVDPADTRHPRARRSGQGDHRRTRGFLTIPCITDHPDDRPPTRAAGCELAKWITSPQNPLTRRVMVNRIWQHLFGQGLVRTVDNFGTTGDKPTPPGTARLPRDASSCKMAGRSRRSIRADHAFDHLPAEQHVRQGEVRRRPGQQAAVADEPAAAGGGGDPRLDPRRHRAS